MYGKNCNTKMKKVIFFVGMGLSLTACEKSVSFKLDDAGNQLVVEAAIGNGNPPIVTLSNSFSYFSEITKELLLNSFFPGAQISLSDEARTQTSKEYSYSLAGNNIYYYTIDSTYSATSFNRELNKSYSIRYKTVILRS